MIIPYKLIHLSGTALQEALAVIRPFPSERDFLPDVDAFVQGAPLPKVLLLYGVRRTGKTTAMLQSILHLPKDLIL